jgi:hypothetical protein
MQLQTLLYRAPGGWSSEIDGSHDSPQTLAIAFGAPRFASDLTPFAELRAKLPSSHIVGCSTAGEIYGNKVSDDSVAVAIVRFASATLRTASARVRRPDDSFAAGLALGRALADPTLRSALLLSNGDGLGVNGTELVNGINEAIGGRVVVTGGLAGDGSQFETTWVLYEDRPQSGLVAAIGFYGESLRVGHGSKGGWDMFGPERIVTRSTANVLYELDGRPALQLYKEYLGDRAAGLPATGLLFPLALRSGHDSERRLVRTILGVDEAAQSLTFAGDIPQGALAQLMRSNLDRLVEGAADASAMACVAAHGGPVLSIAISCVGRRLVLGERVEEEIEAVLEALPASTGQIGFYSYGEISPYGDGPCALHNQTMTLTTIAEAP